MRRVKELELFLLHVLLHWLGRSGAMSKGGKSAQKIGRCIFCYAPTETEMSRTIVRRVQFLFSVAICDCWDMVCVYHNLGVGKTDE